MGALVVKCFTNLGSRTRIETVPAHLEETQLALLGKKVFSSTRFVAHQVELADTEYLPNRRGIVLPSSVTQN